MRKVLLYAICSLWNAIGYAYLPQDFQDLVDTHTCEYCDLTRSFIKIKPIDNDPISVLRIEKSYLTNGKINGNDFIQTLIKDSNCLRLLIAYSNFQDSEFSQLQLGYSSILNNVFKNHYFKALNASYAQINNNIVKFSTFEDVSFSFSDLQNNQFHNSVFKSVNFSHADIRKTNFSGSQFYQCNFEHAILDRCNFTNTNVTQEELEQSASYSCVIMPDGSIYDNHGKDIC